MQIPELDTLHKVLTKPRVEAILLCLTQSITIFSMQLKWFFPTFCCGIKTPVADSHDPQSTSAVSIFLPCISPLLTKVVFVAEFTPLQQK